MAYRRAATSTELLQGDKLTSAMVGIGMLFTAKAARDPNIEDTLLAASVEGMERDDLRVLAILVTWLGVHHSWMNADRLIRAVEAHPSERVRAFWAAVAKWLERDRRLARLARTSRGSRVDLLRTGADFQVKRRGEDVRFETGPLRVPAGALRDRQQDVVLPAELAKRHRTYRQRVLIGSSYRADMWAELDRDPALSAAELARRTYGSFATAWQVKHDRALLVP